MADGSGSQDKKRNRFLMDRPGQKEVAYRLVAFLTGIGALYAVAVWFLLGSDFVRGGSLTQVRLAVLGVHAGYFVIGGGILLVTTLLLTHRYAGPALVMERAVEQMRRGDYEASTRDGDFHKTLAEELRNLRDELREREDLRGDLLTRLEGILENGDVTAARDLLCELRVGPTASTAKAAQESAAA